MNLFRIELFCHGSVIGHISKENHHDFSFAFYGTLGGKDPVGKEFGGIGLGLIAIDGRGFFLRFSQVVAAFTAELITLQNFRGTLWKNQRELRPALVAEFVVIRVFGLAFRAFHI
jgi:hypothetical protein